MGRLKFKKYLDDDNVIAVRNKSMEQLGDINFDKDWNCWVYNPEISIVLSADCMDEISNYMKGLEQERKQNERRKRNHD